MLYSLSPSSKRDVNLNASFTWLNKEKEKKKKNPTTIHSFFSPAQDCEGLPDVSWPPSDLAAEHGREAQQQKVLHWVGYVSRPRCCPGGRVSQHAGGSQVPACWQRHLPGREYRYTHQISKELIVNTRSNWKKKRAQISNHFIQSFICQDWWLFCWTEAKPSPEQHTASHYSPRKLSKFGCVCPEEGAVHS